MTTEKLLIKVVNDLAERGVGPIKEYSGLLTSNESELQFLFHVVEDYRS
uniref:Putative LOC100574672 [Acyrthosiphon pisum] n=1 Tax=Lepeophtheirus salmonis TaxID=72036 RepID=A0A0K2U927_LEPSM